ncbi:reticulophagy regulator 3-like [Glandiceps talaboti]
MAENRDCDVPTIADFRPQTADSTDPETMHQIKAKEDMLKNVLCPLEPVIMYMQGVLVWEKPSQSVVLWLCVNGAFWFITTTNYRVMFLLAVTGIVLVFVETFKSRIWPEIRVRSPDDNEEGWTPVHPKLLSVPELCHHLAETWVWCCSFWESVWLMRSEQPGKFCLWACSICSVLVIIGHYIPGVMLSYIIVLSLLLWPVVDYHNINQKIYNKLEPVWMQLEYSMVKRGRRKKTSKQRKQLGSKSDDGTVIREESSSESESDIAEFIPSPNFETTAALARAVTDPDSASEISEEEAAGLLGRLSREPSFGRITDEDVHTDNEGNFMAGIGEIPAHDDSMLQDSTDALHLDFIPTILANTVQPQKKAKPPTRVSDESMHFVPSHFDDSDHDTDGEKSISHGLEFPDVTDLHKESHDPSTATSTLGAKTSDFVSQTVSTVMQGTYSAIRQSKQTLFGADGGTEDTQQTSSSSEKSTLPKAQTPSDIDADEAGFEMLDPTDLDSYDEHAANDGLPSQDTGKSSYLGWLRKN